MYKKCVSMFSFWFQTGKLCLYSQGKEICSTYSSIENLDLCPKYFSSSHQYSINGYMGPKDCQEFFEHRQIVYQKIINTHPNVFPEIFLDALKLTIDFGKQFLEKPSKDQYLLLLDTVSECIKSLDIKKKKLTQEHDKINKKNKKTAPRRLLDLLEPRLERSLHNDFRILKFGLDYFYKLKSDLATIKM